MNLLSETKAEALLQEYGQQHLLRFRDQLTPDQLQQLLSQISEISFSQIDWSPADSPAGNESVDSQDRVERAAAPQRVILQPMADTDYQARNNAAASGRQLLGEGKVAVITVAGGQGSRLGFDHPKGMFPIGPVSERTLFRIFAEQIRARRQRHSADIHWYLMTSLATHQETVAFFEEHNYFDLGKDTVSFFQQGSLPAVDQHRKILMDAPDSVCLSPDGHGGMVSALQSSGCLAQMRSQGVEHLFYHQVDNPTVIMCDPVLLGLHAQHHSQLTTNVVRKTGPDEPMGVLVDLDGHTEIIEYSELSKPEDHPDSEPYADQYDKDGSWVFWAGNTAIHVFRRDFLEYLTEDGVRLPLHQAHKNVRHIDDAGHPVETTEKNAIKFERFIFDALPLADSTLIVEGDRSREFNPVKNATGTDSPQTSRDALSRIGRTWLREAGHEVDAQTSVEISPLIALDAEELAERLTQGDITVEDLIS